MGPIGSQQSRTGGARIEQKGDDPAGGERPSSGGSQRSSSRRLFFSSQVKSDVRQRIHVKSISQAPGMFKSVILLVVRATAYSAVRTTAVTGHRGSGWRDLLPVIAHRGRPDWAKSAFSLLRDVSVT
jgi:hypothetical protein